MSTIALADDVSKVGIALFNAANKLKFPQNITKLGGENYNIFVLSSQRQEIKPPLDLANRCPRTRCPNIVTRTFLLQLRLFPIFIRLVKTKGVLSILSLRIPR